MNVKFNLTSRRRFLRLSALLPATVLALAGCGAPRDADPVAAATLAPPTAVAPAAPTLMTVVELTVRWNGLDPQGRPPPAISPLRCWPATASP